METILHISCTEKKCRYICGFSLELQTGCLKKMITESIKMYFYLFACYLFIFETLFCEAWLSWNLYCRPDWPSTQKSTFSCLSSAGSQSVGLAKMNFQKWWAFNFGFNYFHKSWLLHAEIKNCERQLTSFSLFFSWEFANWRVRDKVER